MKNIFSKENSANLILATILSGHIEAISKKKTKLDIIKKNEGIYFKIEIIEKELNENQVNTNTNINSKTNHNSKQNPLLKRVMLNNHLINEEGILYIWGMNVLALPIEIYEINEMKNNIKIRKFLKILGETQGRAAYQIIANKFGNNEPFEIFKNVFLQTDLIGVGKTKIINFDEKKRKIKLNFSDTIIINKNEITNIGIYLLGIFNEVLSSIYGVFFEYKLIDKEIIFEAKDEKYYIVEEKKELGKFMGINIILKSFDK